MPPSSSGRDPLECFHVTTRREVFRLAGFEKVSPILTFDDAVKALGLASSFIEELLAFFEPDRPGVAVLIKTENFVFRWASEKFTTWPAEKRAKYLDVALAKVETSWVHKKDTANIRASELRPGETHWPGGVFRDGIAVGVSGARPYLDYLIATVIVTILKHMTMLGLLSMVKEMKDFVE